MGVSHIAANLLAERGADQESRQERLQALGGEIRSLRRQRGFSAVALAQACGVSSSLISQVERGLTAPSLEVLWAIAKALDVPMGTFFQPASPNPSEAEEPEVGFGRQAKAIVVRADRRKRLGLTPSLTYQLLSPDLQHKIEFIWAEFPPGEEGPVEPFVHAGEEQMVVIQGEMHVWIGDEVWQLGPGDAIAFDSSIPHRAGNRGSTPAIIIAAITPPSF